MASKKKRTSRRAAAADPMAKLEGLLAQLLLQSLGDGVSQRKRALVLSKAGLTNSEIAPLIGVSAENVGVILYQARKSGTSKRRPKKK